MSAIEKTKPLDDLESFTYFDSLETEFEELTQLDDDIKSFKFNKNEDLQMHLRSRGYQIPTLSVERAVPLPSGIEKDFHLPSTTHDIYEETSFNEFRGLLSRLQPGEEVSFQLQLDYKDIEIASWKDKYESMMILKSAENDRLYELVTKQKPSSGPLLVALGFGIGTLTSLGIFALSTEIVTQ